MGLTMLDLEFPVFKANDTTEDKLDKIIDYLLREKAQIEFALGNINGANFAKEMSKEDQLAVAKSLGGSESYGDLEKGYTAIRKDVDGIEITVSRKAQIFTGTSLPEPPYAIGDLWAQGDGADILVCVTERAEEETPEEDDWGASSGYGDGEVIVSRINQTAEAVQILARFINLNGVVTANENFKILLDGSMEAVNGRFSGNIEAASGNIGRFVIDADGGMYMYDVDNAPILCVGSNGRVRRYDQSAANYVGFDDVLTTIKDSSDPSEEIPYIDARLVANAEGDNYFEAWTKNDNTDLAPVYRGVCLVRNTAKQIAAQMYGMASGRGGIGVYLGGVMAAYMQSSAAYGGYVRVYGQTNGQVDTTKYVDLTYDKLKQMGF